MIVDRKSFGEAVTYLACHDVLVVDCETTGLRVDHGDRLFSVILNVPGEEPYYFNFSCNDDVPEHFQLGPEHLSALSDLCSEPKRWVGHNIKYDAGILAAEGIVLKGELYDTGAIARLEHNDHFSYTLAACAQRIGEQKSDAVDEYIAAHKLWTPEAIPGKKGSVKRPHYDKVPFDIIAPYGVQDGAVTGKLYDHQCRWLQDPHNDSLRQVVQNEVRLTRTVYRMERRGVLIDRDFAKCAIGYESERVFVAEEKWQSLTGVPFIDSGTYFSQHLPPSGKRTKKSDPEKPRYSYDAAALELMALRGEAKAQAILDWREAKKRLDLFQGLLYHADDAAILRANFNQSGAKTGRFSCSAPNLQQLSKDDVLDDDAYPVRRALVPRPGYVFVMFDFDQQEYRLMLDTAQVFGGCEKIIRSIREDGLDVHQATADGAGITRSQAKTTNFSILFGAGLDLLSARLAVPRADAARVRDAVLDGAPGIGTFLRMCARTARNRGYVHNWFGRRWRCDNPNFAFRAPNFVCQGGGADVIKVGMNMVDGGISAFDAHLVLQIHDELVYEVSEADVVDFVPWVKDILEKVYPYRYLPLTVGVDYSVRSLADKREWA
jgi:DNA polymerase-1